MRKLLGIALAGITLIALFVAPPERASKTKALAEEKSDSAAEAPADQAEDAPATSAIMMTSTGAKAAESSTGISSASHLTTEEKSQRAITQLALETLRSRATPESLLRELDARKQQPVLTVDANEDTGEMKIIRTDAPAPGTRYFHAQFFIDEKNQPFLQHLSVEFKPGPRAMENAVQTVKELYPQARQMPSQSRDFTLWELGKGYVVWVKKMDESDLKDNPFNSYSKSDVGTIRLAVELNPHDGEV